MRIGGLLNRIINKYGYSAVLSASEDGEAYVVVTTAEGYEMSRFDMPDAAVLNNLKNKPVNSGELQLDGADAEVIENMIERCSSVAHQFWTQWLENNPSGDVPLRVLGRWYSTTYGEVAVFHILRASILFLIPLILLSDGQFSTGLLIAKLLVAVLTPMAIVAVVIRIAKILAFESKNMWGDISRFF